MDQRTLSRGESLVRSRLQSQNAMSHRGRYRAASKSLHQTLGYFLSTSQQEVSADNIQNSAVGKFSPKTEGTKTKAARYIFFWCLFPSCTFWILCNLLLLFTFFQVCLLVKETAEVETGMEEKFRWDQANIRQKLGLVWRNGRKLAKLSKTTFTYRLPLKYFMLCPFYT